MSETKPQKRFVSKKEYQHVMRAVCVRRILGLLLLLLGATGMIITVLRLFPPACSPDGDWLVKDRCNTILTASVLIGIPSVIFLKSARRVKERADQIVSTTIPLSDHNDLQLSLRQTLLRGSDVPPTVQQAELLRAIQAGQETPQEQLLRATTTQE